MDTGTIIFLNGNKYAGAWKNGRFSGLGTFEYNNKDDPTYGNRFTGEHKNGLRHRRSKYSFSNGGSFEGLYEKGYQMDMARRLTLMAQNMRVVT